MWLDFWIEFRLTYFLLSIQLDSNMLFKRNQHLAFSPIIRNGNKCSFLNMFSSFFKNSFFLTFSDVLLERRCTTTPRPRCPCPPRRRSCSSPASRRSRTITRWWNRAKMSSNRMSTLVQSSSRRDCDQFCEMDKNENENDWRKKRK